MLNTDVMDIKIRRAFGILIAVQAAHSLEEYAFRLFDVFGPARMISGLVCSDPACGFAVINTGCLLFGIWCYLFRVRPGHRSARAFAWVWAVLEFANGVGHCVLAVTRGSYIPGVATAPVLVIVSVYLVSRLLRTGDTDEGSA